ncbi:MAG: Eco57I restriction-modification methylase domain-containing protein, partial [Promethearchaeota archaeon]
NLVHKMVDYLYVFGQKILDPSCGSGNFLIIIILKILKTDSSNKLKLKAINNVFGFDINPLAVLTTKVNIFLIFLKYFDLGKDILPPINVFGINSFFPEKDEINNDFKINTLYHSFDSIIGNPPWLTYKDLSTKDDQIKVRHLAQDLGIKPSSQYITHIELASIFFYLIPLKFLKLNGKIFFVITKSVLNGDHCYKFRAFSIFNNIEIWDFPSNYFFNIQYICLKAEFIGNESKISIKDKYPIKTKVFDENVILQEETLYSSLKIEDEGAKIILPLQQLEILNTISTSPYKKAFFQGATLVPRTLVFFKVEEKKNSQLIISTDPDIISRAKKEWNYKFQNKQIESHFWYKTFLNMDLIPFYLTKLRNVFLPVNEHLEFDLNYLKKYPLAKNFYNEMNKIYQENKKTTSDISTLFSNLNYWNKLTKQSGSKSFIVLYNASGSNLKAAVIQNPKKKIIVGSENYYFSTESMEEAYYLSAILNSPALSRNIKLIKSSRHIHKRPFSFPIPFYDETNDLHNFLMKKAIECETIIQNLYLKNPDLSNEKIKIAIKLELNSIDRKVEQIFLKKN